MSDDDAAEMVYLVLDYLGFKVAEYAAAALELLVKVLNSYYAVASNAANTVKRKTALLGIVGLLGLVNYLGVYHGYVLIAYESYKYGLVNSYHVCSHAHTALFVGFYCVEQVADCLHIRSCGRL